MLRLLFICHGNICRSPMAQYVMQDLVNKAGLSKHFIIDSAATSTEEIGNGVHYGTRQKLREVGVPCGDHRAVQITKKDYNIYDYLIVMDSNNLRNLKRIIPNDPDAKVSMLLDYANRQGQSIADPWYTGNFDATYRDVLEGCQGLLEYLRDRGMV